MQHRDAPPAMTDDPAARQAKADALTARREAALRANLKRRRAQVEERALPAPGLEAEAGDN